MAISSTIQTGPYTGNGSQTAFPFDFTIASAAEIEVRVNDVNVSSTAYTVLLNANGSGTVTFLSAPASGASVLLLSNPDFLQESQFANQAAYNLTSVNAINRRQTIRSNWLAKIGASAANTAVEAALAASASANYFSTIAAGVAETPVGQGFSSNEGGTLKLYERTGTAPFYVEIAAISFGGALQAANNLSDLADAPTARGNLGLPIGTSGATVPLLSGTNSWAAPQTFSAQTNLGALTVMTAGGFRLVGATGGFQFWPDSGPSKASSIDVSVPGGAVTDDLVFGRFNGSAWAETFRLVNATKAAVFQGDVSAANFDNDGALTANSATKIATQSAVKTYVDNKLAGLNWKLGVRAATTANGTLATAFASGSVIDGVTLATGDRILLKNQTAPAENGIYTVNASGAPTRANDADTGSELVSATVYISEGTTLADQQWTCSTNAPITLGTTGLTFTISNAGGGTTTNSITFNNGGSGAASGTAFNGSSPFTISYNTIGAAPLASPAFTGNPTAPTPSALDNDTSVATTAFVQSELMPSVQSVASASTYTPVAGVAGDDAGIITALAANLTIAAPTGTAIQMQPLILRIKDNGTARTLTWNAIFRAIGVTLPTTTVISKTLYVGFIYNATDSKWDCVLVRQEA